MSSSKPYVATHELAIEKHVAYIVALGKNTNDLAYHLSTHLRMNGVYWGLTALALMGRMDALGPKADVLDFVMSCWDEEAGGFGSYPQHDAHVHTTLNAIQVLVMYDALDRLDVDRVVSFLLSLQQASGAFAGDRFGETDTRFLYCAVSALSLVGALDKLDVDKTVGFIRQCRNFDGGFGRLPGAESHAGQVFVCTAALAILGRVEEEVDGELLGWWLAERQLPNGGLNGRPEKLEDVCYSWWVLSGMAILGKLHWIDANGIISFILASQDVEGGGISDRPDNMVDVFHTLFGIAGLSLLGYAGLEDVDPVYCMPARVISKMGLRRRWTALPRRAATNGQRGE